MKVLLISADFPPIPSGEANHSFYLAKALAEDGAEVHVLTSAIEADRSDPRIIVHSIMTSWSWTAQPKLVRFVKESSPDAVLLVFLGAMYQHHPMMTFAATFCRAACPKTTFVTQFEHLGMNTWTKPIWTLLGRKLAALWARRKECDYEYGTLLRDSHAIISLSEMHLATLARRLPSINGKSHLIPPPPLMRVCRSRGEARAITRHRLGVRPEESLLIYYGYLYGGKGVETLLEAVRLLTRRGCPTRLVIVGGPLVHVASPDEANRSQAYFEKMKQLVNVIGIEDRVIWTGAVSAADEAASSYLCAADVGVLPFDGGLHLNNSSFAALAAHGLPVVSTQAATTEQVFRNRENVVLCPPKSPTEMADAIHAVVTISALKTSLVQGINALADEWFSWTNAARRTMGVLRSGRLPENDGRLLPSVNQADA